MAITRLAKASPATSPPTSGFAQQSRGTMACLGQGSRNNNKRSPPANNLASYGPSFLKHNNHPSFEAPFCFNGTVAITGSVYTSHAHPLNTTPINPAAWNWRNHGKRTPR